MILMMDLNKPVWMEVFLMSQFQTFWKSGNKDNAILRDIMIHLLFQSLVVFQSIRLFVRFFLLLVTEFAF